MTDDQFLSRLGSLPVVNSAWTNAVTLYQRTKEWNFLTRTALGLAETSIMTVAETAKPLVGRLQPQIDRVNILACEQLSRLEVKYPAITHSTDQLVQESKEAYESVVKPVTDRVSAAREYGTSAYTGVVNTGLQKVGQVKKLGTDALSSVMVYGDGLLTKTFSTPYGQYMVRGVDELLAISELYVDKYLPADPEEKDVDKPPEMNAVWRACYLSIKVRRRLYTLSVRELQMMQASVLDSLVRLNNSIQVIDFMKTNFDFVKNQATGNVVLLRDRLRTTWIKIVSAEIDPKSQNYEDQTILLARRLAHQLQVTMMAMTLFITSQSTQVVQRLRDSQQYTVDIFQGFLKEENYEEVPTWLIGLTREKIAYVQEGLSLMTEYLMSTPLSWLTFDLEIDNLFLDEPEVVNCNGDAYITRECVQVNF